ncbi:MAG TPA: MMPL family transporter [Solirubrobacteraceae bacterium]|nr:MMPL family transporter [Solirubrobacteraceae bacterium]
MRSLAAWCLRHRRLVLAVWVAALVGIGGVAGTVGASYSSNFSLPSSDSQRANDLLKRSFPAQAGDQAQVVFHVKSGSVTDPAVRARMQPAFAQMARTPHVVAVQSPYAAAGANAVSRDGRTAYAVVRFDQRANTLPKADALRVIDLAHGAAGSGLQVEAGGQPIERAQNQSGSTQSGIGLLAAIIVLLFTFGSVVAMGMPIITALFALGVGLSLVTLATRVFDVADFSPQLAAMIGLGVGIDYALFVVTRYRAGLREGLDVREAVVTAIDTAGRAVFFAGTTVIVALLGMLLLGVTFLRGPAVASALAVLFTMIASLTLLPALLGMLGRRIDRWRFPIGKGATGGGEGWGRWARFVQRRPWPLALGATALLLTLCIPTLSLRLGSSDAGSDPAKTTTRKAYDLLAQGFGPGFNGPLQVVAQLPHSGDLATAARLRAAVAAQRGVATVTPAQLSPTGGVAVLTAYPSTSPQSASTQALVTHLRDATVPQMRAATGAQVHIGGPTAVFDDLGHTLTGKLPLFIGVVVLLSALLLMAVFRSVLVPLKAVLMNVLSIGAAFGVVVAVFQWGWLASLIGVDRTGPIESFLPVMLFAIVFGLSMDYEVFLMSRVHEEWVRRRDASRAVVEGVATTGRVITAAATIMVCVFASFVLGDSRVIKLFGVGLASAVFIDAFVIRTVLVPAIMELLGRRAWWLPGWLDRRLPRVAVEPQEAPEPSPA